MRRGRGTAVAAMVIGAAAAIGCADPFEGTWEQVSGDSCGVSKFTVDGDLHGTGTLFLDTGIGCQPCEMSFDSRETRDLEYAADVRFAACACPLNGSKDGSGTCLLRDSEDEATCTIEIGPCGSSSDVFRKVD